MKKFVGFYYRYSFKGCLWAFLSLVGLMVLSSSAIAQCTQDYPCTYGDFRYKVSSGTVTITQYIGAGGDVVIPSTINSMPVVGIGYYYEIDVYGYWEYGVFEGLSKVNSVTIPDSVTSIRYNAFGRCENLTSIVVYTGNTAYSSQDGVLYNKAKTELIQCPGGKSGGFTIPDSVTSIWFYAFASCSGLTSVTIPNSVTSIRAYAFDYCSGLTSVTIPNSVTSIQDYAFDYCRSLTKAYFLGNAPSMGTYVFLGCASNFSVCYTAGSTGFTSPTWKGYRASVCGETTSSTTTSIVTSSTTTTTPPTAVSLIDFNATPGNRIVTLTWSTAAEIDNAGFNLYRSESENGEYIKINDSLIPAQGSSTQGASYEYVDTGLKNRKTYYYKLEDIDLNGNSTMHDPTSATPRWILGIFGIFKK